MENIEMGKPSITDVCGNKQPKVSKEIYDYSLEQALAIWREVIGDTTEGSYYPTKENSYLWRHEDWKKELNTYRMEADKYSLFITGMIMFLEEEMK